MIQLMICRPFPCTGYDCTDTLCIIYFLCTMSSVIMCCFIEISESGCFINWLFGVFCPEGLDLIARYFIHYLLYYWC
jgi:hypothetical protein